MGRLAGWVWPCSGLSLVAAAARPPSAWVHSCILGTNGFYIFIVISRIILALCKSAVVVAVTIMPVQTYRKREATWIFLDKASQEFSLSYLLKGDINDQLGKAKQGHARPRSS